MIESLSYNVTYEIVTPQSAEYGDADKRGFEVEDFQPDDIEDLIGLLRHNSLIPGDWSSSPGPGPFDWWQGRPDIEDYSTMAEVSRAIHPANDRSRRYLAKAIKLA